MNLSDIPPEDKARVLLEALPYIQRFRGSTFVVKYGGAFMDDPDPALRRSVATDIVFLASVGINVVVVHGGGKAISRAMNEAGIEPVFNNGLRVTDEKAIGIVEKPISSARLQAMARRSTRWRVTMRSNSTAPFYRAACRRSGRSTRPSSHHGSR